MIQLLNVLGLDALDDAARPLALALPVFVLATLIALLGRLWRSRKRRAVKPVTIAATQPVAAIKPQPAAVDKAPVIATALAAPQQPNFDAIAQRRPAAKLPPADVRQNPIEALQSKLNEAMKVQSNASLAPLFLDMARHHKAAGDDKSYLAALRSAAGLGAQHGPRAAHAEARLQLAEAAFDAGDLIGACEQWQMARNALQDDGQKDAHARVEQRMRENGCPTDWVLTDF